MTAPPPIRVRFEEDGQAAVVGAIRNVEAALKGSAASGRAAASATAKQTSANAGLVTSFRQVAAAIGLVQMARFINQSLEAADAVGKLSQATGISAEKMSVLAFAARQAEVETGQLRTGLRGLGKSLVELQNGNAQTVAAFRALGLEAKDLEGLSLDEAFLKVANAQAQYADGAGKATAAGIIFGDRVGGQLIPLLDELSGNGFANASAEASRLGLVFSDQATRDADAFGDALGRLKGAAQGVAVEFGIGLAPSVTESISLITEKTSEVTSTARILGSVAGFIVRAIVSVFQFVGQGIGSLAAMTVSAVNTVVDSLNLLKVGQFREAARRVKDGVAELGRMVEADFEDLSKLSDFLYPPPAEAAAKARASTQAATNARDVVINTQRQREKTYEEEDAKAKERRAEATADALIAADRRKHKQVEAEAAAAEAREDAKRKADAARREQEALAKTAASREAIAEIGKTAEDVIARNLAETFNAADSMGEIWRNAALTVVQSINQIIARLLVQLAIQQAVNAASGLFGGGGSNPTKLLSGGAKFAAEGGYISGPGTGTSDSIPAYLSNGEYVVRAAAVQSVGTDFLDALNGMRRGVRSFGPARFADGGAVGGGRSSVSLEGTIGLEDGLVGRHIDSKGTDDALVRWATRSRKTLKGIIG